MNPSRWRLLNEFLTLEVTKWIPHVEGYTKQNVFLQREVTKLNWNPHKTVCQRAAPKRRIELKPAQSGLPKSNRNKSRQVKAPTDWSPAGATMSQRLCYNFFIYSFLDTTMYFKRMLPTQSKTSRGELQLRTHKQSKNWKNRTAMDQTARCPR